MRPETRSDGRRRRSGFTLVEMLVVVALIVLMMTIIASIFQAATGAISASRTFQELDDNLRLLDITLRSDLDNITARMTPPVDPTQNLGYFEYAENAPADDQGEDTDDTIGFTSKAPEGRSFTGRVWVPNKNIQTLGTGQQVTIGSNTAVLPVTISSQYAEIIYFLRNGNLYRRVLLVVPERNGSLIDSSVGVSNQFNPSIFNGSSGNALRTSWLSVNDISARSNISGTNGAGTPVTPIANTLGDLTNRENRFAHPRWSFDFWNVVTASVNRDGLEDDGNGDGIPDYHPTLTYSQVITAASNGDATNGVYPSGLMNEDSFSKPQSGGGAPHAGPTVNGYARATASTDLYAFPFIFPGAYSKTETYSLTNPVGWLHALDVNSVGGAGGIVNHSPLEIGDSLPTPTTAQTWWGYPTWRETASAAWVDPVYSVTTGSATSTVGQQPYGLRSLDQTQQPTVGGPAGNFLPPLGSLPPLGLPSAISTPFGSDGAGYVGTASSPFIALPTGVTAATATLQDVSRLWEDDLIMTGVRSFDVKAYDPNAAIYNTGSLVYSAGYYDLGYAATDYVKYLGNNATGRTLVDGTPAAIMDGNFNPIGFGHEGRIPPNTSDNRVDPQRPYVGSANGPVVNYIGDNTLGVARLRRVWDTWSGAYTNAPAVDVNYRGSTLLPPPLDRPIYPSYPAPYPQALRGIQIQVRVVDPKNEKVKILTIVQDFSDKL